MHKNDKILDLEQKIMQAREDYYNNDNPLMTDEVYDCLCDQLKKLCPNSYALISVGATQPTDIDSSNGGGVEKWIKVKHKLPMGSLNKINTPEEMIEWVNDRKQYGKASYLIMPKFDGLSLECVYEKGILIEASLRGDGIEGFDILPNVKKMRGVQPILPTKKQFNGSIRGEIILYYDMLKEHFPEYSNVRNSASGICKRFDGEGSEFLNVIFYKLIDYDGSSYNTETDMLNEIKSFGLPIPQYEICNTADELNAVWIQYWQTGTRQSLPFQIDGLVIETNEMSIQNELGESNMRPNHGIAFKFPNETKVSKVIKENWDTGSSGHITPVVEIEPVIIGGTTVCNVNLHNMANIEYKNIMIGSEVIVSKRNDIIPYIEEAIGVGTRKIVAIDKCPSCGAKTEMNGKFLICPNLMECPAQLAGRIRNWITTIKVLSWGETIIENLVNEGKINSIVDIYKLTEEELAEMPRLGEKSAAKLYSSLHAEEAMTISLKKLLGGFSIPMVGETIFGLLIDAGYTTLDKMFAGTEIEFAKVNGVGAVKARNLYVGLQKYKTTIYDLLDVGIKIKDVASGKFNGKIFCLTGASHHSRDELIELIVNQGGIVKNSVVKNLSYLVCADTTTTKYKDAVKRGIPIISEEILLEMAE